MTLTEFKATLSQSTPPSGLTQHLEAMWYAANNDWDRAHTIVQDLNDATAAWVHAYLHREEGDRANAGYWYRRANRPMAEVSLEAEWAEITSALLATS